MRAQSRAGEVLSSEIRGAGVPSPRELPLRQRGENGCRAEDGAGPQAHGVFEHCRGAGTVLGTCW